MRNLLNFLSRYSNVFIFLILEAVSVWLLVNAEGYQSSRFLGAMRGTTHYLGVKVSGITEYVGLRDENRRLAAENLALLQNLDAVRKHENPALHTNTIVSSEKEFTYISARIINNSVNKQRNFISLDKGRNDGIEPEMAVTGPDGVVGIVVSVSDNFSFVMSVLNLDFRMSVRLRKSGYFGSLNWDGLSARKARLSEIPYHVSVAFGDTIETSGFSALFPPGIPVGTITDIDDSGGAFYTIGLNLFTEFRKLNYVYVIKSISRKELILLEEEGAGI
ncbi:MAG: rod shape-determining protein MreC [Bacteroidales bacterium]